MAFARPAPVRTRPLSAVDRPDPTPGAAELLVRVRVCAVCRTDHCGRVAILRGNRIRMPTHVRDISTDDVGANRRPRFAGDAWLLSDDAHGLGVIGGGRGSTFVRGARADVPLQMGTLSKALGAYGGYLCASAAVVRG